ncbi:MAG: FecR domain-containing protein [Ignavibacterium sp.]
MVNDDLFIQKLNELLNDESFNRWIKNEANEMEQEYWNEWLSEEKENQELVFTAKKFLNISFIEEEKPDVEYEFHKLEKQIANEEFIQATHPLVQIRNIFYKHSYAVAASFVLVFTILTWFLINQFKEIETKEIYSTLKTNYGEKKSLTLADGSKIILNVNSSITYNPFSEENDITEVQLQGEAYFDIVHNPNGRARKFRVHTNDGLIEVLGTKFTVESRKEYTQVVLSVGKVKVSLENNEKKVVKYYLMKPGELTKFSSQENIFEIAKVNPEVYSSWINNQLIFDNTPLSVIKNRIENTYGVEVIINDEKLLEQRFSGSIGDYDLQSLLKGLSTTLKMKIKKEGNIIVISKY